MTVAFMAVAAGSILYVVQELFNVNRKFGFPVLVAWMLLLGLALGFEPERAARWFGRVGDTEMEIVARAIVARAHAQATEILLEAIAQSGGSRARVAEADLDSPHAEKTER